MYGILKIRLLSPLVNDIDDEEHNVVIVRCSTGCPCHADDRVVVVGLGDQDAGVRGP